MFTGFTVQNLMPSRTVDATRLTEQVDMANRRCWLVLSFASQLILNTLFSNEESKSVQLFVH
ncbi:hypothetical protein OUZ56_020826 [Daphnia magna]|uniref:Uncharacterized protein n=1 Tax=Daphnia magna TaxID=35525 RepID=A0ABQ9ZGA2_9CRUS|nr:hypothetical protein OUZ56_020826 [Daphnia magna]